MRGIPKSRATGSAITAGVAIALPATANVVKIKCSGDAFVGFGKDDSPPAAADTNSVYLDSGVTEYYTVGSSARQNYTHIYVYGATGTVTTYVSFYGG